MLGILISSKAAYVISGPRPERETSEKAEPGLLEKVDPIPKFTVLVDDSFLSLQLIQLQGADFKYDHSFLKF